MSASVCIEPSCERRARITEIGRQLQDGKIDAGQLDAIGVELQQLSALCIDPKVAGNSQSDMRGEGAGLNKKMVEVPRDKLEDLIGAVRSINRGRHHQIRVPDDDEPCFWQRKEWIEWTLAVCEDLAKEVHRLNAKPGNACSTTEHQGADIQGRLLVALERLLERFKRDLPPHLAIPHEVTIAEDAIARAKASK